MGPTSNKDINKYVHKLVASGWNYEYRGKHIALKRPNSGQIVIISRSPSDRRVVKNLKKIVRRVTGDVGSSDYI